MEFNDVQLERLFPFRLLIGEDGLIADCGSRLAKLVDEELVGHQVLERFTLREPIDLATWQPKELGRELVILEHHKKKVTLKGEVVWLQEQEQSLFIGSPWVASIEDLSKLGLKLSDYPVHQGIADMFFVMNAQVSRADSAKRLARELEEQNRALAYRQRLLTSLIEHLPAGGAMVMRQDGRVLIAGGTDLPCQHLREVSEEGVELEKLFGQQAEEIRTQLSRAASSGFSSRFTYETNQSVYSCSVSYLVHPHQHRSRWLLIFQNITEDLRNQSQAERLQRLDSVGLLAGGIAHDFNNYLASILGNISLAREMPDMLHETLEDAEAACENARQLTRQLLTFSKGGDPVKEVTDLGLVLQKAVKFSLSGANIAWKVTKGRGSLMADCDAGQVSQVISNLCVNAQQAMNGHGEMKIQLGRVNVGQKHEFLEEGTYLRIRLSDNGPGIAPEICSKIWNPYFTTKKEGSGLGLATCSSIISRHDGHISVKSELGKGTTFTILLPAFEDAPAEKKKKNSGDLVIPSGRILVMDDQAPIRMIARRILEKLGQEVITVEDGSEAIGVYRESLGQKDGFDMVVLDMTIPGGMGGQETIERLREIDPRVYGVVCSGYSEENNLGIYQEMGFDASLPKPFTPDQVRQVLATRAENVVLPS